MRSDIHQTAYLILPIAAVKESDKIRLTRYFERTLDYENETSDHHSKKVLSPGHAILGDFVTSDQTIPSR